MKVVVANVGVGILVYAWWCQAGREWFFTGMVFGCIVLAFGTAMGIWCNQPKRPPRRRAAVRTASSQPDDSAFDQLTP